MKALLTAGGRATRLRPITYTINKHLIPLANQPMIFYAIEKLAAVGVTDIAISVNPGESEVQKACGDGSRWNVKLTYIEQTGGPLGIAHVVNNAKDFLGNEPFIFYLGDNIILGSLRRFVEKFEKERLACVLALAKVKEPQRFGVPELRDGRIVRVEEKPSEPKSDYAVTGIYVYDSSFFEAFKHIQPSARGEYEISDIHTWLIENGKAIGYEEITGWWKDTGKPEDLLEGNALLLTEVCRERGKIDGQAESGAVIQGAVSVGEGTIIGAGSIIRGPTVIGRGCSILRSTIGPCVSVGDNVTVEGTDLEDSLIMDKATLVCGGRITHSILGRAARVLRRHDRRDDERSFLIGDNARIEL